jgi:hypothetical protein
MPPQSDVDEPMTVALSCALMSDAPLSTAALNVLRIHFAELRCCSYPVLRSLRRYGWRSG